MKATLKASIIIPARNASATLPQALESILKVVRREHAEVLVVNDRREKSLLRVAASYPVSVIEGNGKGPAAARNIGVQCSSGQILLFLDADCRVFPKWLKTHLENHYRFGELLAVGGSVCLEPNTSFWARCDHYCSWYNVNPYLPAAWVPNHPAANLSISRKTFEQVGPFNEDLPRQGVHEETEWQGRFLKLGGRIRFEPRASVWHSDRNDPMSFVRHSYRWGYNSILVKGGSGVSRFPWVYRNPRALVAGFLLFAMAHTAYTSACWLRVGKMEPLLLSPLLFLGRLAYAAGMASGGIRENRTNR